MKEQSKGLVSSKKVWIILAMLSLFVLIVAGGCNSTKSTATSASATGPSNTSEQKQSPNPAVMAAMEIRRLQANQENALTSDQKEQIKTILNELISTTDPGQDFLQQKADAIQAVLTDKQKSYLTTQNQGAPPQNGNGTGGTPPQNGNGAGGTPPQNGSGTAGTPPNGTPPQEDGTHNRNQKPEDIYKQVLNSLT